MAINVSQAFKRTSIAPIDETLALTKAQMVSTVDTLMPAYYFTICQDDGKIYLYDKSATPSASTGKFTEFSGGGGGGSSDVKFFTTTDTLSKDINGTKVVAAADLPGVTWSDLKVGSSVIKDAKGTMGLVTTITGTTSVTVTTATTSTPTVELTQAQYDALATKDPDTIYFITDSQANAGTYMGAYDTIYSTTEHVVGSWMGKPVYQKTVPVTLPGAGSQSSITNHGISNFGSLVSMELVWYDTSDNRWMTGTRYYDQSTAGTSNYSIGTESFAVSSTQIRISGIPNTIDWSARTSDAYVTIRYTKTTDTASAVEYATPNDYSTSEKIVGTWTDGRPIYQITRVFSNLTVPVSGQTLYAGVGALDTTMTLIGGEGWFKESTNNMLQLFGPVYNDAGNNVMWRSNIYQRPTDGAAIFRIAQDMSSQNTYSISGAVTIRYLKSS